MTTERVFHHHILIPWLLAPLSRGGLGWNGPASGHGVNNAIAPFSGILWSDAFDFLRTGNDSNALAWDGLLEHERKTNGSSGAVVRAEQKLKEALEARLAQTETVLEVLRTGLTLQGQGGSVWRFSMWNRKPSAGDTTASINRQDYTRNILRTSPEVCVLSEPMAESSPLGGRAGKKGVGASIRLDQGFHLNGLPYGSFQLKEPGAKQSARIQGRKQMAEDFVAFAVPALIRLYAEYERSEGTSWPGLKASKKRLSDSRKRQALGSLPLWLGKAAWRATLDAGEIWLASSSWEWLCEVDETVLAQSQAQRKGESFSWESAHQSLLKRLTGSFSRLPDVLLDVAQRNNSAWPQTQAHVAGLLGTMGLDQEIQLFGHPTQKKDSRAVSTFDLLTPRAPQRAAMGQILERVEDFYAHESDSSWLENDLRSRLNASMPGLSREEVESRVKERLCFRNGQDAYSMLIQGAAGLGKTNIAVWISLAFHDMLERNLQGQPTSQAMFDYIVVLTDRLDLRKNIAEEAELGDGSKGAFSEAKTADELANILSGRPLRGTGRIVVVNLHKFPSLREKIKAGTSSIRRRGGRIAFIIDEVHRSNQGKLNAQAQEAFLDDISQLSSEVGASQKKNLIIGLTASPTDTILARFGRWQPGTGEGNPGCWTPHFAYGMTRAIEDGYVLNPLRGLMRLETTLDIAQVNTLLAAEASKKAIAENVDLLEVYENETWQKQVALRFALVFLTTTMKACRDSHNANRVGRGKAMITVPSIKAAIGMQKAIREAIRDLASHAQGTPWERYADLAEDIANRRVFLLYSDPGKRASVAQRDETGVDSGCGKYNPAINGVSPTEDQIIDMFKCKDAKSDGNARNAIMVVVDKLLTGFDESTLHTLMIARNLSGVALLQTMCRVNRTRSGKNDCLVIDASYDPEGVGLGVEAARVFRRYGGLATSRLDGLALMEQVAVQRKELLKIPVMKSVWVDWKKTSVTDEARTTLLADALKRLEQEGQVLSVRRKIGGYLSQQSLADPIMKLDAADRNEAFLSLLWRLHNALGAKGVDNREPVQFTVQDVDVVAQESVSESIRTHLPAAQEKPEDLLIKDMAADETAPQTFEHLLDLQDLQVAKAQRVALLRQFLMDLGQGIATLERADTTIAGYCRSMRQNELDPIEAAEVFAKMVANVKLSKVPGGKGRGLWVDQVPGRRELMDWLREPGRMDLAMTGWMTG